MKNEVPYFFVSAEEYSRQTKMGVEEIKRLCRSGQIEHYRTDGGYFKIKVYKDGSVPLEEHIKIKEENIRLKTILEQIRNTAGQV